MRHEIQHWHHDVLALYQAIMFETLIYPHNITTESAKTYQFEDAEGIELARPLRGYFAMKDVDNKKTKFFLEESYYQDLPVRVNAQEEVFYKESARAKSVVIRPTDITPFRIIPACCWNDNKEFIDSIAPFKHTHPDQWTLNNIIALQGYIGKTFCGICSLSEFGKSSIYLILDSLTKRCPVFQPRSVPGVLSQITGDGNMIFDEVHDVQKEVKDCMENFSLQVAGNSPHYINGAKAAKYMKPRYDVSNQSITYLYNVYNHYSNPDKQFWNYIWTNRKAMESRFLCMCFEGKLLEEFDKEFDISKVAAENTPTYIKIAKHLLYLKQLKQGNDYKRRYKPLQALLLKGRHKIIYDEITWLLDLYCGSQSEYDKYCILLNKAIVDYQSMLAGEPITINEGPQTTLNQSKVVEEDIIEEPKETDKDKVLMALKGKKQVNLMELEDQVKVERFEELIKTMLREGDIWEPRAGFVSLL